MNRSVLKITFSGPPGCGKSKTLYSVLRLLREAGATVTIEDGNEDYEDTKGVFTLLDAKWNIHDLISHTDFHLCTEVTNRKGDPL